MLRKPPFALASVFLLACAVMLAWAVEPIIDGDGEASAQLTVSPDPSTWSVGVEPIIFEPTGGFAGQVNPLVLKFFPATFQPAGVTNLNWRFGAYLLRGSNDIDKPGLLIFVTVNVEPDKPGILDFRPVIGIRAPDTNHFFTGKAEAVLAVSALDPSGHNNGSFAFVISGKSDAQVAGTEPGFGRSVIARNAWSLAPDPGDLNVILGLTGPISVAIDDTAQEVIVVEQTTTVETWGGCPIGQSPLRFFRLVDAYEVRRLCIDGVGDSADIEIDRGFGRNQAFISRSFSKGNISVINLINFTESFPSPALYPAGDPAPAPGLDLDLAATGGGRGYLAAPELGGVKEFTLANPDPLNSPLISADVYYHKPGGDGDPTGLQEVSASNFPNGQNNVRRGIVISRGDPTNYPNRADQVTRINLVTRNTNRMNTGYQTMVIGFVPQRSTDQSNQEFFLRVKVENAGTLVTMKLKKYDSGTVP
jgi:hypothetical protein